MKKKSCLVFRFGGNAFPHYYSPKHKEESDITMEFLWHLSGLVQLPALAGLWMRTSSWTPQQFTAVMLCTHILSQMSSWTLQFSLSSSVVFIFAVVFNNPQQGLELCCLAQHTETMSVLETLQSRIMNREKEKKKYYIPEKKSSWYE